MPFALCYFLIGSLQIAKKTKKNLENCKAVRKEGDRINDKCFLKVRFLNNAMGNQFSRFDKACRMASLPS